MLKGASTTQDLLNFFKNLNLDESIVDHLKYMGVDSSFETRMAFAKSIGINDYKGTLKENTRLLKILKDGIQWHRV